MQHKHNIRREKRKKNDKIDESSKIERMLLIQMVNMAHICENYMIQIKDMFQIVATWLQLSTEEYLSRSILTWSLKYQTMNIQKPHRIKEQSHQHIKVPQLKQQKEQISVILL